MSGGPRPPLTFSPLDDRDGVPGNSDELTALARRYADTAAEIEAQAAHLAVLTSRSQDAWKGLAGDNFVEVAGDLATRISKAKDRYEAAARALTEFADDLVDVQTAAYSAVRRAQAAEDSHRALRNTAPLPPGPGATPEQLVVAGEEQRLHDRAVESAAADLSAARRDYAHAVEDYHRAAGAAARILSNGRSEDDLADSWWDRNAGWIDTVLEGIGAVVLVLAIVALVISLFVPGLNVLVLGTALASLLNGLAAGLTVVMLAGHTALWLSDNGEFTDVVMDLVGLATFRLGPLLGGAVSRLGSSAQRIGQGIAAARGGRQAFTTLGLPGRLYDVGQRLPGARALLSAAPGVRHAFAAADEAADAGRSSVAAISGLPTTSTSRALGLGDVTMSETLSLITRIDDAVPGSVRIAVLEGLARTSTAAWGLGVQGSQTVHAASDVYGDFVVQPRQEKRDAVVRTETVRRWSSLLRAVP